MQCLSCILFWFLDTETWSTTSIFQNGYNPSFVHNPPTSQLLLQSYLIHLQDLPAYNTLTFIYISTGKQKKTLNSLSSGKDELEDR